MLGLSEKASRLQQENFGPGLSSNLAKPLVVKLRLAGLLVTLQNKFVKPYSTKWEDRWNVRRIESR
jgi:hypothetical protein